VKTRLGVASLLLLAGCSSAALPGADNALEQTDKAYQVQAEADLRNASNAEEAYFAENGTYTTDLAGAGFNPSGDVTVSVLQADAVGFCIQAVDGSGSTWHLRKSEGAMTDGPC
jgi:type II secretory pathway pseudopilin PulG